MTQNELRRYLTSCGCTIQKGNGHDWVILNGRRSMIGKHGTEQVKPKTLASILRHLELPHPKHANKKDTKE